MDALKNLFLNKHGVYARMLQFETLVIIIFVIFFFTYFFDKNYAFVIILLVFAFYIANNYAQIKESDTSDFNQTTMIKLNQLQDEINKYISDKLANANQNQQFHLTKEDISRIYANNVLDSLYIDSNMIHFLHSILPLSEYNQREFYLLLKGTNNIIKIRKEIEEFYETNSNANKLNYDNDLLAAKEKSKEISWKNAALWGHKSDLQIDQLPIFPNNTSEMFSIALHLKTNTVNNVHNFIYTIPKIKKMYDYTNNVIERYNVLISRNTDIIYRYHLNSIKANGINSTTKFVDYNTTKPFDESDNHSIIPNKQHSKLINFYL